MAELEFEPEHSDVRISPCVPGPAVSALPGSLLEMQSLRLYARPTESGPAF